jgi:hypothetical protein
VAHEKAYQKRGAVQTIQLIRQYGAWAVFAIVVLWLARGYFTDVGRSLWQTSGATGKGWIVRLLLGGAFGCFAQAAIVAISMPVDLRQATLYLVAANALLAVAGGMVVHSMLAWIDLIASIQRGEPREKRKQISLF